MYITPVKFSKLKKGSIITIYLKFMNHIKSDAKSLKNNKEIKETKQQKQTNWISLTYFYYAI